LIINAVGGGAMTGTPSTTKSQDALGFDIDIVPVIASTTEPGEVFDALRDLLPAPAKPKPRKPRIAPPDGLRTRAEAAAKLGCSLRTLDGHVASGALRWVNVGRGKQRARRRFTDTDLDEFIANQKRKDVPACPSAATSARQTGPTTFKSEVFGFTEAQRRRRDAKRKR
jgi:hypothetical protein